MPLPALKDKTLRTTMDALVTRRIVKELMTDLEDLQGCYILLVSKNRPRSMSILPTAEPEAFRNMLLKMGEDANELTLDFQKIVRG